MSQPLSPFRTLAKTYASQILTREQYIKIRAELLRTLQQKGEISAQEMKKLVDLANGKESLKVQKSYSTSDWVIIGLGIVAAIILGVVLYG